MALPFLFQNRNICWKIPMFFRKHEDKPISLNDNSDQGYYLKADPDQEAGFWIPDPNPGFLKR